MTNFSTFFRIQMLNQKEVVPEVKTHEAQLHTLLNRRFFPNTNCGDYSNVFSFTQSFVISKVHFSTFSIYIGEE